ncbi:MAG TPA: NAD(P)H-hydrate dehydratase, partial [Bacteroidales bacterium]|nr:NAD(P)H-hydrate dehydratase [Bacteroidales bacterium]
SIDLMERAASKLAWWITKYYKTDRKVLIIAGPGNNGGDALALSRILMQRQYEVEPYLITTSGKLSADCDFNKRRLSREFDIEPVLINDDKAFPEIGAYDLVIDGIFGSGLSRPAAGIYGSIIRYLNASGVEIVSIDIPSGLMGEDNRENDVSSIIRANHTLTFQFPFLSFLFADNANYTGKWHILDIGLHPQKIEEMPASYTISTKNDIDKLLINRKRHSHKGSYGHVICIGGSYGMLGAALLAGNSALRAGAGLVTLHVPSCGVEVVQTAFPEAIVNADQSEKYISQVPDISKYSAVAIGPGIGKETKTADVVKDVLVSMKNKGKSLVIDADALNIISENSGFTELLPKGCILTPHPIEFDRLAVNSKDCFSRHENQIAFSKKYQVVVVLKGAYTGISFPDGRYLFNTSGNPGMASGGSGDVLTGIIVSLLAQGMDTYSATVSGVYLHGVAGDLAAEKYGMEALIAGDLVKHLGNAFKKVRSKPFFHEGRL